MGVPGTYRVSLAKRVDGGVTPSNNPALQALMTATMEGYRLDWPVGEERMLVVSVGTGKADAEVGHAGIIKATAAIHAVMMQLKLAALGQDVPLPNVSENQLERFRVMQEQLINAHTMGILALNGTGQQVVVPIIPRRTHIPRREIKTFRTSIDSQQQIRINVKEGENVNPEACADLGTCLVRGLPDGLAKGTPIEVCFECTHDGRLEVTARLPTIQQVVQTQIARTLGMSDEAIEDSRLRINEVRIE